MQTGGLSQGTIRHNVVEEVMPWYVACFLQISSGLDRSGVLLVSSGGSITPRGRTGHVPTGDWQIEA